MCAFFACILLVFSSLTISRNADWRNPETFWRDTLEFSPNAPHAIQNLAAVSYAKGNFREARVLVEEALLHWPDKPMLHFLAGQLYGHRGDREKMEEYLNRALQLTKPNDIEMTDFHLGTIYLQLDKNEEAITYLNRAREQDAFDPNALNNIGIALAKVDQLDDALETFDESISLFEERSSLSEEDRYNFVGTLGNRGSIFLVLGQLDAAEKDFDRALELSPNDTRIQKSMLQLERLRME